jgi:hypothetical protein
MAPAAVLRESSDAAGDEHRRKRPIDMAQGAVNERRRQVKAQIATTNRPTAFRFGIEMILKRA